MGAVAQPRLGSSDADIVRASEPAYYDWRSRSGCTFCFFQQKVERVNLLERHPEAFAEARTYEKVALTHGSPFTWSHGESLDDLAIPDRVAKIREEHARRIERARARRASAANPLASVGAAPLKPNDPVYRAVQIQATGAEEMPATAAAAGRRSFPVKSQIVQALTSCQAFAS